MLQSLILVPLSDFIFSEVDCFLPNYISNTGST